MVPLRRITLRDIAQRIGVSHVTVSLALRNNSVISAKRRTEVQKMAEEMGYQPDPMLSSLIAYRRSKRPLPVQSAIAWINHRENPDELRKHKEFEDYWNGASNAAHRFGYRLDEFVWSPEYTAKRLETILQTRNVHGVLIPPQNQPSWGDFHWEKFSIVRFGESVQNPSAHLVTFDQFHGVFAAVKKIHAYGYERIGLVIPGDFDLSLGGNHTGGFLAAQSLLALPTPIAPFHFPRQETFPAYVKALQQWLRKHRPDAILTADQVLPKALAELGVRIPHDIALATTSVVDIPGYAGINQNSEEIGRVAMETLIALIHTQDRGTPAVPRRILIDGTWIDGPSLPDRRASRS